MCLEQPSNFPKCWKSAVGDIILLGISWGSSASLDFSRCVLVASSSSASLDFSRLCSRSYQAIVRDQLLRVISCWYFSCDDQQRALRDSEATMFCEQEPAVGFVSVFLSGY
ncbi:cyclic nucleotide-gated ion channel 1-like [Dorcoceras hygrometricum]|uniref:Cyclic nucleotide-gated ion channel 1-like n=1 Tax=Dorcoceras hygrometricum TaxID=472368 RepID=A0A2Z7AC20_9LAMI|nr:cyclic nucleotide-gated ion channel 1-like [Dorcoceras hygrometricum]